jgi:ATP-dependent Lon protease
MNTKAVIAICGGLVAIVGGLFSMAIGALSMWFFLKDRISEEVTAKVKEQNKVTRLEERLKAVDTRLWEHGQTDHHSHATTTNQHNDEQ